MENDFKSLPLQRTSEFIRVYLLSSFYIGPVPWGGDRLSFCPALTYSNGYGAQRNRGIIAKNGRCSISAEQDDPPKYIRYGKAPSVVPNALRGSVGTAERAFPYKLATQKNLNIFRKTADVFRSELPLPVRTALQKRILFLPVLSDQLFLREGQHFHSFGFS